MKRERMTEFVRELGFDPEVDLTIDFNCTKDGA